MTAHEPRWEIARAARAAARDNACDSVTAAFQQEYALAHDLAQSAASVAVENLAHWLADRGEHGAAGLLRDFAPPPPSAD